MNVEITPKKLAGTVAPPSSKSMTHRAILAAALSQGTSTLRNVSFSQDIRATLDCVTGLGCHWEEPEPGVLSVQGIWGREWDPAGLSVFDCGESGSTLRFLLPVVLALEGGGQFTGRGRLMERPQKPYFDLFLERGIHYEQVDNILTVQGELEPGEFPCRGTCPASSSPGFCTPSTLWKGIPGSFSPPPWNRRGMSG